MEALRFFVHNSYTSIIIAFGCDSVSPVFRSVFGGFWVVVFEFDSIVVFLCDNVFQQEGFNENTSRVIDIYIELL